MDPPSSPSSSISSSASSITCSKRAVCWKHFTLVDGDITKAKCNHCGTIRSRGKAAEESLLGTQSLNNHLRDKHPELFSEIDTQKKAKQVQMQESKKRKLEQAGIEESFGKAGKWASTSEEAIKTTRRIGEMMCLDDEPFRMVEKPGFMRFLHHALPRYELPSRHHFSETVIPKIANGVEKAMKKSPLFLPNTYIPSMDDTRTRWVSTVKLFTFKYGSSIVLC